MTAARAIKLLVVLLTAIVSIAVAISHTAGESGTEDPPIGVGSSLRAVWRRLWANAAFRSVGVAAITVVVLIARTPSAFTAPQFVVEDAGIFWLGQYRNGFWASLFEPYAGYVHVIPRLIAGVADWFPYVWAPVIYVWSAALVTGWTAATIASLRLPRAMAEMLGVSIVLVAHGGEVWATPTNLQWITATALPLIAITESPASLIARTNQFAFVVLAGLSGPFAIVAAPVWLYRLFRWSRRSVFDVALCGVALLCALFMLVVVVRHPTARPGPGSQFLLMFAISVKRSFAEVVLETANRMIRDVNSAKAVAFVCVIVPLAMCCFAGTHVRVRRVCLWFLSGLAAATAWHWRAGGAFLDEYYANERYFYIPMVMLAFSAITLLFEERRVIQVTGVCLITLMAASTVNRFERMSVTDYSREWAEKSPQIGKQPVEIQYYPGWRMTVPLQAASPR
jgi:hypothetical protein